MRHRTLTLTWLACSAALLLGASVQAQFEIAEGSYVGKLSVKFKQCSNPSGNDKIRFSGFVNVAAQAGPSFQATGLLQAKKSGAVFTATPAFFGTTDEGGLLDGAFTFDFSGTNGYWAEGSGTVSGRATPGRLKIQLDGTANDVFGVVCHVVGTFKGKGPPGPFACDSLRTRAAARLLKKALLAHSRFAKDPAKDPTELKRGAALAKATNSFLTVFDKAAIKAAKKGAMCSSTDAPSTLANQILAFADTLQQSVTAGVDNANALDRKLRSKLIKLVASLGSRELMAESRHIRKPNPAKRDAAQDKARKSFIAKADKALAKGTGEPNGYTGAPPPTLSQDVDDFSDLIVATVH